VNGRLKQILNLNNSASAISSLTAILVGLLAGFIVLLLSNPSQALGGFGAILTGGVSDRKNMGQMLYFATPIIMTGLSVSFASRTGLFNIGASGQFIAGAYCAVLVSVRAPFLPGPSRWMAALLAAMIAGALWGLIPGALKAFGNVNEVISCIMMNYIGMYLVNFLITQTVFDSLKNQSMRVSGNGNLPKMGLDLLFREGNNVSSANFGIVIAILMAILLCILLEKTQFGYELKACGFNQAAAKYAGINERRSIILSMTIAGAMAGLGGALLYLAGSGKGIDVVDVLAAEGFNGIPVALLALNSPVGVIFSGLFIAYLTVGGFNMQLYSFAPQVIDIIIAIIIYFSAFALLLKNLLRQRALTGQEGEKS
jgi:simple sugar transport system permease protein